MSTKTYPCNNCVYLHSPKGDEPCQSCADGSSFIDWRQEIERLRAEVDALRQSQPAAAPRQPLTRTQREIVFRAAEKRVESDINLAWRHAIVDEVERAQARGLEGGVA